MRGASPFPPAGQGQVPAQLLGACPAARSLPSCWVPARPLAGDEEGIRKEDPGFGPPLLSGLRAVPCVCALLFSSPWLMKYLGSLSCSPVSAFRFGFPNLSWGFGGGGSSVSLSPPVGAARGTPPRERFRPRQPGYFAGLFLSPVAFLAEHPRSCVEVGPGLPVSLHVLTKTPHSVLCPQGGRGWPSCPQVLQVLAGPWLGAECPRGALQGPPTPRCTAIDRRALTRLFGD